MNGYRNVAGEAHQKDIRCSELQEMVAVESHDRPNPEELLRQKIASSN